tara:strand:+ start:149 stop:364 length:216 start_codon:yes stop_codon:yes gene_type:complete
MKDNLTRRDAIAIMVMQAIIIKKEVLPRTPEQVAFSALKHADALLEILNDQPDTRKLSRKPFNKNGNLIKL